MSKTENELKTAFIKRLRERNWYARRLEDQFAVGVMDMVVGIPFGPTVAIEAKIVRGQTFGPTPRQLIELQRWEHEGGNELGRVVQRMSWIMGFKEGATYLHPMADSVKIEDCVAQFDYEHPTEFVKRFLLICLQNGKLPSA